MMRVAIVVVTYNSAHEIGGCLDALAGLEGVEAVVVDNASSDHTTTEVLVRNVALLANRTNVGFAAAVNQGVRATSAPYVLLLNPDAHLVQGLDKLTERCAEPGTGAAGGLLLGSDGTPQSGFMARSLPSPAALAFEVLGINRLWPSNSVNWHYRCRGLDPVIPAFVEQPAGAFLMFPRYVWERLGGFDERFYPVWFEDVDFCARIKQAGLKIMYEPGAVARHAGSHSIEGLSLENREEYWYGNLLEYAAKHYSSRGYRTICAAVVMGSFFRAVRGFGREGFKAISIYGGIAKLALGRLFRPQLSERVEI
jgi:N-acetylglucosaminyl-diphospho-decaprenol L-rhamnosyltransferase